MALYKEIVPGDKFEHKKFGISTVISAGPIPDSNDHGDGKCIEVKFGSLEFDEYYGWEQRQFPLNKILSDTKISPASD